MIILPSQIFAEEGTSIDNDRPIDMYQQFSVEEKKQRLNEIIEIPLEQQKIRFEITEKPDVKVTHIIELGGDRTEGDDSRDQGHSIAGVRGSPVKDDENGPNQRHH